MLRQSGMTSATGELGSFSFERPIALESHQVEEMKGNSRHKSFSISSRPSRIAELKIALLVLMTAHNPAQRIMGRVPSSGGDFPSPSSLLGDRHYQLLGDFTSLQPGIDLSH